MGIINLTPEPFQTVENLYALKLLKLTSKVLKEIEKMENQGATFIDIGAESTRLMHFKFQLQKN